jgi:hypothetical protein
MSSSGKPTNENVPHAQMRTPPSGAYQSSLIRTADVLGRSLGSTIAKKPAAKMPNSPARMK